MRLNTLMCENNTAWMLRRDGEAIPCIQHIYAGDCVDETLYAAQWLYLHTLNENTKAVCLSLIKSYAMSFGKDDLISSVLADIKEKPYVFLTADFIDSVAVSLIKSDIGNVKKLCRKVADLLNSEFLRARYGGLYYTKRNCRDMYFRISSTDFNWDCIICDFVNKHKCGIDTVTVVYDEESTGRDNCFYIYRELHCDKLPIDIFIQKPTV